MRQLFGVILAVIMVIGSGPHLASGQTSGDGGSVPFLDRVAATLEGEDDSYIAIAGPADIVFAVDVSYSMDRELNDVKSAIAKVVDSLDAGTDGVLDGQISTNVRVGIVTFGGTSDVPQTLTGDAAEFKQSLRAIHAVGGSGANS